jgi:hypothetical protein
MYSSSLHVVDLRARSHARARARGDRDEANYGGTARAGRSTGAEVRRARQCPADAAATLTLGSHGLQGPMMRRAFICLVQLVCVTVASVTHDSGQEPVRIALYCSGGASSCKTPTCCEPNTKYYATLTVAAQMAFGDSGFSLVNLTAADVVDLEPSQQDVVVFPGGSGM